ncbi:methylamine utilization protein MauF [Ancylobacter sp. 6x-1]|uniref:Methylamine utilization protein MauF n=1 Tax=Ancylobacter crimeensis TaxID=2579147 RepID=A0ABT0DD72_9HYPH|nr:cytochrome c biogenesis protein CcdA [Ancylobacter crimeensis]MCK0197907.1 methylamine utilization protein MauF [Ancylobacter crimeensis]
MTTLAPSEGGEALVLARTTVEGIPDCVVFPHEQSRGMRVATLLASAALGVGVAAIGSRHPGAEPLGIGLLLGLTFMGGLLSTWSPCGYSSLCLLRPSGNYSPRSLLRYTPTVLLHGLGYAAGAVVLGGALGFAGSMAGFAGASLAAAIGLGLVALLYGAHQLGFVKVPYPQRRAQVPHDARQRFPKWFIGGLYGFSLGLNYLTYVQTPILYLVTAAAVLSGYVVTAIALFAVFNAGRFLPILVNYLPVRDIDVQNWLARRQEGAALLDGALLVAFGAALLTLATL